MKLTPLPTRVFGIGWQKTGTTSLAQALTLIGFDCAHWITPRWARDVWTEIQAYGKSLTLERHYAATDFPIAPLYRELDRAYPHSKFILTVRNEMDWLNSVERHWGPHNRWRASWDNDCFSHKMHRLAYGRKSFDPLVFLERYRRHNAEVREYFKNRQALLVVPMDAGWEPLCAFLDKPVPNCPYPKINTSVAA